MNKKTGIIVGIALTIAGSIGAFLYFNQAKINNIITNATKNKINPNAISYNCNYTYEGFINDRSKTNFSGNVNFGIYSADKGLKQRLILNKFETYLSDKDKKASIILNGWDIIQDEYKKYIKIGKINIQEKGRKPEVSNKDLKELKQGNYYLADDSIFKEKFGEIYNKELIKLLFRSTLTSNPYHYLRKNEFSKKFRQTVVSERLAHIIFPKQGDKYVLTNKFCEIYKGYEKEHCENTIKKLNDAFNVNWEGSSLVIKNKDNKNLQLTIKINYENKIFKNIEATYDGVVKGNIEADLSGVNQFNFNFQNEQVGIATVKYKKGKQDLFINLDIKGPGIIIKGKYENGKGKFVYINQEEKIASILNIENSITKLVYKQEKIKGKFSIDFDNKTVKGNIYDKGKNIFNINNDKDNFQLNINQPSNVVSINFDKNTYEGKASIKIENQINFKIESKKEKNNLHIVGGGIIVEENYYGKTNHKIDLDLNIADNKSNGYVKIDENKFSFDAKYKDGYDIKLSVVLQGGGKGNLTIKGKEGKGKITADAGYNTPFFTTNYDISKDFHKIHIDSEFAMGVALSGQVNRNLDNNGNDNIDFKVILNNQEIVSFKAKGKITKGGTNYKIPTKFEKIPKKYAILAIYNLPDFSFSTEMEEAIFMKEFFGTNIRENTIFVGAIGVGILSAALVPKLEKAQQRARDTARKADLSVLSTALQMYFNDNGIYPKGKNMDDIKKELVPTYISKLPYDPKTHKAYFYRNIIRKGGEDAGAILGAQMEDPRHCNIDVYSEQDLEKLIKENENEASKIEKLIKNNGNFKKGCYYILTN